MPPGTVAEDASAAVASPSCATITFCSPPVLLLVLVLLLLVLLVLVLLVLVLVRLNAPLAVTMATWPAVPPLWLEPPLLEALVRDVDLKSSFKTLETKCTYNLVIIEMKYEVLTEAQQRWIQKEEQATGRARANQGTRR